MPEPGGRLEGLNRAVPPGEDRAMQMGKRTMERIYAGLCNCLEMQGDGDGQRAHFQCAPKDNTTGH